MIRRILLFLFFLMFLFNKGFSSDFDPKGSAKTLQGIVETQTGNPDALQKNFISPMLGNGTMKTFNQQISFSAGITCPSSKKFLEIIMQPKGTGDVDFRVYYDSNFDGNLDGSYVFSSVSGLCANGFIRCDPGSWNNCRFYKVFFNGRDLFENETSFVNLNSCFCINNYCGNSLSWRNKDYVLTTFGGAVVSAFLEKNPRFAVSKTQVQDVVISYYGQDSSQCKVDKTQGTQVYDQERYFDNPYELKLAGEREMKTSNFTSLFAAHVENLEERVCTVKRIIKEKRYDLTNIVASASTSSCTGQASVGTCGEKCLQFQVPIFVNWYSYATTIINIDVNPEFKEKVVGGELRWCTDFGAPYPCTDDDGIYSVHLNGNLIAQGAYGDDINGVQAGGCPGGCPQSVQIPVSSLVIGQNSLSFTLGGAGGKRYGVAVGCKPFKLNFWFNAPLKGCYITDNYIEDTCDALRKNSQCVLKDQIKNGVMTVKNQINTGLTPLLQCQEICGEIFCYDDWTVEEHYLCKTQVSDFDPTRPQKILSTINYGGGVLTFDDVRKEKGIWKEEVGKKIFINLETGEACPLVCKVKIESTASEIGQQGPVSSLNVNPAKTAYEYRECVNGTCPYDSSRGESVVQNCACLSDFKDALVALQAVRLAGQDLICSTGQEKTLPGF